MPINRNLYYTKIDERLNILRYQIDTHNSINLTHLSNFAEDFYAHFFNLLFGFSLVNLNVIEQNAPSIDLIDHENKIIVQVSAVSTKKKISDSLKNIQADNYHDYRFKFISITKSVSKLTNQSFNIPRQIAFEPKNDLYDIKNILAIIKSFEISKLKKIFLFLQEELDMDIFAEKYNVSNKVKTKTEDINVPITYICYISRKKIDDMLDNGNLPATEIAQISFSYGKPGLIHEEKEMRRTYVRKHNLVLSALFRQNAIKNFSNCLREKSERGGLFFEYAGKFYIDERIHGNFLDENRIIQIKSDFELNGMLDKIF